MSLWFKFKFIYTFYKSYKKIYRYYKSYKYKKYLNKRININ